MRINSSEIEKILIYLNLKRYPNSDSRPYSNLPDRVGTYNKTLPGTYQWETHNPDKTTNLTYLGPDWFKEPPKSYALASNFPRENYGPTPFAREVLLFSNFPINSIIFNSFHSIEPKYQIVSFFKGICATFY